LLSDITLILIYVNIQKGIGKANPYLKYFESF